MSGCTLGDGHLEALRDIVVATTLDAPDVALPWPALAQLRALLHSDLVVFEGVDHGRRRSYFSQFCAENGRFFTSSIDPVAEEAFWALVRLSVPDRTCRPPTTTAELAGTAGTSSVLRWRSLPGIAGALASSRISATSGLLMAIPDGYGRQLRLLCLRHRGRDYDQRDHVDLQLLLPHLEVAYRRGQQRRAVQSLTARHVALMELVREGSSNAQIATRLGLAEGTVRAHLNTIYARLGVQSRTEAVNRVFADGTRRGT